MNKSGGKGEEIVVRVIPLQNVTASQLIPVLRPLLPQWSNISSYTPGNVLILLGRAANLDRLYQIVQDVDQAASNGMQLIPLQHAQAIQVASVLNNLQTAARANGDNTNLSIAVDERSNSILLSGPKAPRLRMRVLISQLDAPSASTGNTDVVYLRYLEARVFAPLLAKIAQNMAGKDSASSGGSSSDVTTATSAAVGQNAAKTQAPLNSSYVQAEPSSNAIIMTAPPALMRELRSVVAKLDVRPAQVLVEAVIAVIDESNLASLGIQWGNVTADGTVSPPGDGTATSFPGLGAGIVGIIPGVHIRAVLSLLQNQSGVDILSTPSVVVLDNQKAMIEVGKDVPVQIGSYATTSGSNTVAPYNTFDRKPVTLKLEVIPQINLATSVRLKLNLKNDTLQNPQNPGLTPLINTSKISNSVIINSEDVLVLGGLISRENTESVNKVPVFGDLPIIGPLFQQKTHNQQKRNLMVFIKPIIMKTSDDAMLISHYRYNSIRSVQANFRDELAEIGDHPVPTRLPPWRNKKDLPTPFETNDA